VGLSIGGTVADVVGLNPAALTYVCNMRAAARCIRNPVFPGSFALKDCYIVKPWANPQGHFLRARPPWDKLGGSRTRWHYLHNALVHLRQVALDDSIKGYLASQTG